MKNRIYFDNAATTPVLPEVAERINEVLVQNFGNPSSIHLEGRTSRTIIEDSRKKIAHVLGASIGEVFFTSCGTESNNMILNGAVRDLGVKTIITSQIEHPCILNTVQHLSKLYGIKVIMLELDEKGVLHLDVLENALKTQEGKILVSLMHANNEIGNLLDLKRVSEICEAYGALFHSDTVQTIGYYPIDVSDIKIHFLSGSAHKFHGPKGVGFVYINNDSTISPFILGGGQERNMRAGTENIPYIAGMATALESAMENYQERRTHITSLKNKMFEGLTKSISGIQLNGNGLDSTHYKVLNLSFPPHPKSDLLLLNLDIAGVSVSGGSACSSGAETASHVMQVLKVAEDRKNVRFSFSHLNTVEEVEEVIDKLSSIYNS